MNFFEHMTTKSTVTKPVVPFRHLKDSKGFITVQSSPVNEFFDDWRRYGFVIAFGNFVAEIEYFVHKNPK